MAPGAAAQVSGIAPSAAAARGFVFEVLEQQGHAAGLHDPIIQIILGQLTVRINYEPLQCVEVEVNRPSANLGNPIDGGLAALNGRSADLESEVRKYLYCQENITGG
ncbi:unnamed protein product [Angiostrongylus costaricensis]|uniref:Mediator of RNA polymerase II transcription subunit 18 n=1 Tax=Angiostrongylus costaricensis TaxID=334426 RepID=A0A0R3PHC0_ANGCS|nr:unnamed protein product [Angiostrongylus costaricensis]